jgi:hypothetical protein
VTDVMGVMGVTDVLDKGDVMGITDEELTALALAADPDAPLGDDALALPLYPDEPFGALPAWYMPPAMARVSGGWKRWAIFAIIAGFLVIDAFGLCITYGQLVAA